MSSKIHYRSVPDNEDYLLVNVKFDLARATMKEDIEADVYRELQSIYFQLFSYEHENNIGCIKEDIALRKDSIVGKYMLSHPELFLNEDEEVSYDKIVGAYNVAIFDNNMKMANKILPLFQSRVSGSKDELSDGCNPNVLDYILANGDFKDHLRKIDGEYKYREYYVYENGKYEKKSLRPELRVVKVKNVANG